jgi:hypothetical protein
VESKERLLDDLFGELVRPQVPTGQPKKNWRIALEQQPERLIVAIDVSVHQLFVGGLWV